MNGLASVFKRELRSYFATPVAYVFLVIFLFLSAFLTFKSDWFLYRQADLRLFFNHMPLLLLFLVPAIAMRQWAEERRSGTIELLFTLPITTAGAVMGKFLAAWAVLALALALTFPMVMTVTFLGTPDPGPIIAGYLATFLLAGLYLTIGSLFSALTRNQVIAFILTVVACGAGLFAGSGLVVDFASGISERLADVIETLSFQSRFESMLRGVLELRDIGFFVILTAGCLWINVVVLEERKAA